MIRWMEPAVARTHACATDLRSRKNAARSCGELNCDTYSESSLPNINETISREHTSHSSGSSESKGDSDSSRQVVFQTRNKMSSSRTAARMEAVTGIMGLSPCPGSRARLAGGDVFARRLADTVPQAVHWIPGPVELVGTISIPPKGIKPTRNLLDPGMPRNGGIDNLPPAET